MGCSYIIVNRLIVSRRRCSTYMDVPGVGGEIGCGDELDGGHFRAVQKLYCVIVCSAEWGLV